jgi:hypothetical protein
MSGVLGVLQSLGASRQRDGSWGIDSSSLQLGSIFGGDLRGQAACVVVAGAISFRSPPELAACGKIRLTDVVDEDGFCQAIGDALDALRERVRAGMQTLRKLGCKTTLEAPDPRARGTMSRAGKTIGVVIDDGGDLIVESVDGEPLPADQQAALPAPDEATSSDLLELIDGVLSSLTGLEPTGVAASVPLSRDQLRELQAAIEDSMEGDPHSELDDDDGDGGFGSEADSDEERTVAGVPTPVPRVKSPPTGAGSFDQDMGGTLEIVAKAARTMAVPRPAGRATFGEQDDELASQTATLTTRAPPSPMLQVTSPPNNGLIKRALTGGDQRLARGGDAGDDAGDDEPAQALGKGVDRGGLLDAFDEDDDDIATITTAAVAPPAPALVVPKNRPALVDPGTKAPSMSGSAPSPSPSLSSSPASSRAPTPIAAVDDDEDEEPTGVHGGVDAAADDAFEEGKTRALAVDASLLASLKRGDADRHLERLTKKPLSVLTPAVPTNTVDTDRAFPAFSHRPQRVDDSGFEGVATVTVARPSAETKAEAERPAPSLSPALAKKSVSLLDAFDEDDAEEQNALKVLEEVTPGLPAHDEPPPPARTAPSASSSSSSSSLSLSPAAAPMPAAPASSPLLAAVPALTSSSDELFGLEQRARALEEELASVRARIKQLRSRAAQPRVGDSEEGAGPTEATTGLLSLPILHSVDVHEIEPQRPARSPLVTGVPSLVASDKGLRRPDKSATPAPARAHVVAPGGDGDGNGSGDGVSLVALQGALQELGVLGEGGETQVAASVLQIAPVDDDGDVFGSGGRDDHVDSVVDASVAPDLSVEATRIRKARPASIVLVVDDERARDRLKTLLSERITTIIEPADSSNVMRVRGLADFDAIVLVRPPRDDDTLRSLGRLKDMPQRPRVLVLSGDDGFDDDPFVDLRLELRQRASDVAVQMIDGLEQLGLALMPAE